MKPVLQLALDFVDLKRAVKSARAGVAGGVDWLEVGTPLIKSEGMDAIRKLRSEFPGVEIVADMKTMDTGGFETEIVARAGIDPAKKADDLSNEEITKLAGALQSGYRIEGDLRREVVQNIRRLQSINCNRGLRHRRNLPCRGQRTSTNARTRKGPKKTVGAVRGKSARALVRQHK